MQAITDLTNPQPAFLQGHMVWLLRLEGLALMALSLLAYHRYSAWGLREFALLFLLPDIALLAYALGARAARLGAYAYNVTHTYFGPMLMLVYGMLTDTRWALSLGLIWLAHIGFDRALGYGLKYTQGFRYTHLGRVGGVQAMQ